MIDLNCDLGEGALLDGRLAEESLMDLVTSASIACGFHAGGPREMRAAVERAAAAGVAVGAHPSLYDRETFGRGDVNRVVSPRELEAVVLYQVAALKGFCDAAGVKLQHVKPHGTLYHVAASDEAVARAVAGAVRAVGADLILLTPPGSFLARAGEEAGLPVAREAFADRAYGADGRLVPRGAPGAILPPEVAARQALGLAREGRVRVAEGNELPMEADTICLHGDGPHALETALAVRQALLEAGVQLRPVAEVLLGHRAPGR